MSLAERIIEAVLRKKKMPVSAIEPRAIELGYSRTDIQTAMSIIEKDERVGIHEGVVYELSELFWEFCPFVSDAEKECQRNGWKGTECERISYTLKRKEKPKEIPSWGKLSLTGIY